MGRPKKEKSTHSTGMYRYCRTIGHKFDGTPVKKVFYSSKSKADAKLKADQYIAKKQVEIEIGEALTFEKATFKRVAVAYLSSARPTLAPKTYGDYEAIVKNKLLPYFGDVLMSNVKHFDVQRFFNKLSKEATIDSLRKYKAVLSLVFKFAEINDYCLKNPCDNVKLKSCIATLEKKVYSPEETEKVLEFARSYQNKRDGLAIELMLAYGLRKGEVLGLCSDNIDVKNCTINIVQAIGEAKDDDGVIKTMVLPPKKESSRRLIPISQDLAKRLGQLGNGYVVQNKKGTYQSPQNWSRRNYKKFMQQLNTETGLPVLSPHELRHTRATIWVNSGVNLFVVAEMLGHSDLKMLQERYAHKNLDAIRRNLDI